MSSNQQIVTVPNKIHLCNYLSHLGHYIHGPGLNAIHYGSGRLVSDQRREGGIALLMDNGEIVEAKMTKCEWKPYVIAVEFEFPNGLHISQRSWVERSFIHSEMTFRGSLPAGAKLIAEGGSFAAAKALVSESGTVMMDEMDPSYKPMVLEIAPSVKPDRVLLSSDGKNWKEGDYAWSEGAVHYRMIFDRLPGEMVMSGHLDLLSNFVAQKEWEKSRRREGDVKREWLRIYNEDLPVIECPDRKWMDLYQFMWYVHVSGTMEGRGMLPYHYVCASKLGYPMWWLADTSYMSVVDAWMRDPYLATGVLLDQAMMQSRKGCIPDAGCCFQADNGNIEWIHPEQYDDNPPPSTSICANGMAAWDVYYRTGNLDFVKKIYPHLVKYERWLTSEKNSKLDPDLIAYYYWADVAWDDSKRWGKGGHLATADWDLPVVPVDTNVFLSILRNTLSKFAGMLGEKDREKEYAEASVRTRKAVDKYMWDEEKGFYFDLLPDGKKLDVWTPAGFMPLFALLPSVETYHRMKSHLFDANKFWTNYPLPTLAIDDPDCSYENLWWRGGTWPVINWEVAEGVFKYDQEAGLRILQATVNMMTRDGFPTCTEYYTPVKGDTKGQLDQGWGAMPIDTMLRRMFGLNLSPNGLELKPYLPADWPEASVKNIFVAGTNAEIRYTRSGGKMNATIKNHGGRELLVTTGQNRVSVQPGQERTLQIG